MDLVEWRDWFAFAAMGGLGGFLHWSLRAGRFALERVHARRRR
jgi:hypothetical protein